MVVFNTYPVSLIQLRATINKTDLVAVCIIPASLGPPVLTVVCHIKLSRSLCN